MHFMDFKILKISINLSAERKALFDDMLVYIGLYVYYLKFQNYNYYYIREMYKI